MSTVRIPLVIPTAREDAMQIYKAFKGRGCDENAIIQILAHRNSLQRANILQEYEIIYSEELTKRLASELSGNLKKAILMWVQDPGSRDGVSLKNCLKGTVKDMKAVSDIICSRTSAQLRQLKQVYYSTFSSPLEDDIESEASGDHKRLLLAYLTTARYEGPETDKAVVENDVKNLVQAVKTKNDVDKTFREIFTERSRAHLAAVSAAYTEASKKSSLEKAIKDETHRHFEHALLTILRCAENPANFYARVLRKAMKGLGTNDTTLIRTITTRCEIDMQYIKVEYRKRYGKNLNDAVHSDTSSHYRTFLLALLGPNT